MASAQSASLRSAPGMPQRPASVAAYSPTYPTIPTLPAVPALANDASLPNYTQRQLVSQQLGQLGNQQNAAFTTARANFAQNIRGYGGYQLQNDDPSTPEREDLLVNFDPKAGPGEREKGAIRGERNQANASGMLESSFANQNIASAVQRVSLEAQAIVNQYAASVNQIATDFANQGANLAMQYAGLYGQDAAWAVERPPPVPEAPPPPPEDPYAGWGLKAKDGSPIVWKGKAFPNLQSLRAQHPGQDLGVRQAGDGSYVVVIGTGNATKPRGR